MRERGNPVPSSSMPGTQSKKAKVVIMDDMLKMEELCKSFGDNHVLIDFNLEIRNGEVVTLLGPSGCGKSTTLNLVAGILKPDSGDIYLRGERVNDLSPQKRHLGMVFQQWALFPHMNVYENIAFGLKMAKTSRKEIDRRVKELLELVRLPEISTKFPSQLSGGMQQRVALARSLATGPDVLLLDEPLSNLDELLRREMEVEIRRIQQDINITTLFVTHNQEEALVTSDRVAIMRLGRIIRIDNPKELYKDPQSRFVCEFVGSVNLFEGEIHEISNSKVLIKSGNSVFVTSCPGSGIAHEVGDRVLFGIRPEAINISQELSSSEKENIFSGEITEVIYKGPNVAYYLKSNDKVFHVITSVRDPDSLLQEGDKVNFEIKPSAINVLEEE